MESDKRELGKFYTTANPFKLNIFQEWFDHIPFKDSTVILEPFAGANNIVNLMGVPNEWKCYDIKPEKSSAFGFKIEQRDTIANFPTGYKIGITNPPYLAKNSATKHKMIYQGGTYDDLYKKCLELMLNNLEYVAAIIPESFITAGIFQERLSCIISLTCKMFDDTDCPVCLALFNGRDEMSNDFHIYQLDNYIGSYEKDLIWYKPINFSFTKSWWKFNDPVGDIGIICIDDTKSDNIKFVNGNSIDSKKIKDSSRSQTRVSTTLTINNLNLFLDKCNIYLDWYRRNTNDVFLTSFKGLRSDGKYRRRLDFDTARAIMSNVYNIFKP